jgi:hypothetical protein
VSKENGVGLEPRCPSRAVPKLGRLSRVRLEFVDDGHATAMKFWIGFIFGAVASGYIISMLDDTKRAELQQRVRRSAGSGRSGQIASTVSEGVGGIADAATDRVTHAVDAATTAVSDRIESDAATN